MYHIYIYTPFYKNGNYIPHILEHSITFPLNNEEYIKTYEYQCGNSTYYSYFILDTKEKKDLNSFLKKILSFPNKNIFDYEHKIIKEENKSPTYSQILIDKIGKKLYGNSFKNNQIGNISRKTIKQYYNKYYKINNIYILENNKKYKKGEISINLKSEKNIKIKIDKETENVFIFKHNPDLLFSIFILSDMFDDYLYYIDRYKKGKYYRTDTIFGDFEDYIYISIHNNSLKNINKIPKDFIKKYIEHQLTTKNFYKNKDFDGSCLVKYGYTLSKSQKSKIIKKLYNIYTSFLLN